MWVRLAQAERPPLWMPLASPTVGIARQLEDRPPTDRPVWPAESLGHLAVHRDDVWRLHDARSGLVGQKARRVPRGPLVREEQRPRRGRGSPDVGIRAA